MPNDDPIEDEEEFEEEEAFEEEAAAEDEIEDELEEKAVNQESPSLEEVSISNIPIRVQIEVSRFDVSLEELARMEPGYKLPIEINPRIVRLVAHGKVIGKGEVLEIGDTIGVKITELYK